jgi:glycerophosphoryl diester phosphodiesterase
MWPGPHVAILTTQKNAVKSIPPVICYDDAMRVPWVIAHRGASGHAPENTMAAFRRAVELGARFIETDLHLTRDAQFVAIHDSTLERTTNGHGSIHDMTLAELRQLDAGQWYDREFRGEKIPTLDEVLAFSRENDVVFYLEIKYDVAWGMYHTLVAAIRKAENAARTIVISFDPSTIAAIRRVDPSIMVGLLADETDQAARPDLVKTATQAGARQLCIHSSLLAGDTVDRAHAADLHVVTWTINDAEGMRMALRVGVDGIMTDIPDRLRALLEPDPLEMHTA